MKRPIITVDDISAALREKQTALSVPYNCVVTPSARDMAAGAGLAINREACVAQIGKAGEPNMPGKPAVAGAVAKTAGSGKAAVAPGGGVAGLPEGGSCCGAAVDQDKLLAEIRSKVLAQLPPALHRSEVVDQLIRKHMAAAGCTCDSCRPVATGRPAGGGASEAVSCGDAWKNAAAGALHINSQKLPWKDFSGGGPTGAVHIIDAVTSADGAPFAVGYMEWKDVAFPWKLDYHEVCIVLEGRLCISTGGQRLTGGPGDALYLPKGSEVEFAASGYVKFAYITWPADWNK